MGDSCQGVQTGEAEVPVPASWSWMPADGLDAGSDGPVTPVTPIDPTTTAAITAATKAAAATTNNNAAAVATATTATATANPTGATGSNSATQTTMPGGTKNPTTLPAAKLAKLAALKEQTTAAKDRKSKAVALAAAKKLYAQAQKDNAGILKTNYTAAKASYDTSCSADASASGCVELKAAVDTFMQQVTDADAVVATADAAVKDADAEVAASTAAVVKAEAASK